MSAVLLRALAAVASGLVFGFGLSLSGMLDPVRVRGFLDVAGAWDPSLVFVLGASVTVSLAGYALARRLRGPAFDTHFHWPAQTRIDPPLILGAILFGIGWGLSGFCPGPAVAALSTATLPTAIFVSAMLAGMAAHAATQALARGRGPT